MQLNLKFLSLVAIIFWLVPAVSLAETVVRTGNSVSVGLNQTVENDFYALGGNVSQSGEIKEDMYSISGSVTVNGAIGKDLTVLGGSVQVHSPIGDDVRVIGGEVVIASDVGGDVFVIGGVLNVLPTAKISGNVYFYGGEVDISGIVLGNVMGKAKSVVVNNQIGGMDISAVNLELQDNAIIKGDVTYSSVSELKRGTGAIIEGQVTRGATATDTGGNSIGGSLIFFLIWLFTSLCFFLFFKQPLEKLLQSIKHDTARVGLIGLVSVIVGPVVGVVLIATILGAWLGIMTLLVVAFAFILTLVLLPTLLGGYLWTLWKKHRRLDVIAVGSGILAILILSHIPIIGGLVISLAFIITMGSLLYSSYVWIKNLV